MRTLTYVIPDECHGKTVKQFMRGYLGLSARVLVRQKYSGNGMLLNGARCKSIDILRTGDIFILNIWDEPPEYETSELPFGIVYEDEDYLIADKPANMPVHPTPGHDRDSLLNAVACHWKLKGESRTFRPLYRLDKDTSGILVIAKHHLAASSTVLDKTYHAVCEGVLTGEGEIRVPVGRKEGSKIEREAGHGEPAATYWKALKSDRAHTLVSCKLLTGRTHQIRVHMAHIGHPLAGDDLYGGRTDRIGRQALHCREVHVLCRALERDERYTAEYPADFSEAFPTFVI